MTGVQVVICGGGFAALEGLLRLHRLATDRVEITVVSPTDELIYRPLTVLSPFTGQRAARYPIRDVIADANASWTRDSVSWVDLTARAVHLAGGSFLHYDALLLAIGARERTPSPHAALFTDRTGGRTYRDVLAQIDTGVIRSVALVEPAGACWPLPLYELALLTAARARETKRELDISVITPHPHPLLPFGAQIGSVVEDLLQRSDITLHTGARAHLVGPRHVQLGPDRVDLYPDRIITLPTITGPNVRGIPGGAVDRFIPVDDRCRVRGTDGTVFAAGDATDGPVKHGSLGTQQADTAAAGIAHLAGAGPAPGPLRPVLRGALLTGAEPVYFQAHLVAGTSWRSEVLPNPPWPPDQLVAAEELAHYFDLKRHRCGGPSA